jgi:hypothetical protein
MLILPLWGEVDTNAVWGLMMDRSTSKSSWSKGRIRLGIRRVNRRRRGRHAMMGSTGGVGKRLQTQTQPLGLPCVSNVTQVQPVSSSVNTALQYVSACSRFRLLAAARN